MTPMTRATQEPLNTVFTRNRAEELGSDVWEQFVVPPFFDRLDLQEARKPRVIIGGRGCGKTMLLRYLSYHSTFSPVRQPPPSQEALRHVGLYWRADTQFAKILTGRGLPIETWAAAFDHLVGLIASAEVLDSVNAIRRSGVLRDPPTASFTLEKLGAYDPAFATTPEEFRREIGVRLTQFEIWAKNVGKTAEPIFLPGRSLVLDVIGSLTKAIPELGGAIFFLYVDEYENLLEYQQEIINTFLKHSEQPLIFNVAVKRNGFSTLKTVGGESIMDVADYREHDIEEYLEGADFSIFAAEVLLLTLHRAGWPVPISVEELRNPSAMDERRRKDYQSSVIGYVRNLFPSVSHQELAEEVFRVPSLRTRLERTIQGALRTRRIKLSAEVFLRPTVPMASIVASALLYRDLRAEDILAELDAAERGEENRFTGRTNWVHNNFVGCLLALHESAYHACALYAGFDAFVLMARGNMRHFLELCHQSLADVEANPDNGVPPDHQAQSARHASAGFVGQIRRSGRLGNRLHSFVLRLGSLFALAHQRPAQSEPEITHFTISGGTRELGESDIAFLREAVKWSVLFEEDETKQKNPIEEYTKSEWVLNPIYAPYFGISYRKRRKLQLSTDDFLVLETGTYDQVRELLRTYAERWRIDIPDANPTLFSHLEG